VLAREHAYYNKISISLSSVVESQGCYPSNFPLKVLNTFINNMSLSKLSLVTYIERFVPNQYYIIIALKYHFILFAIYDKWKQCWTGLELRVVWNQWLVKKLYIFFLAFSQNCIFETPITLKSFVIKELLKMLSYVYHFKDSL